MQTSPAQVHGAKVQIYFGLSKKNALFRAFLCLEDAARAPKNDHERLSGSREAATVYRLEAKNTQM